MTQELSPLQTEVRQLFHRLFGSIAESLGFIEEQVRPAYELRDDASTVEPVLVLRFVPRKPDVCPLTLTIGREELTIHYATQSYRELGRWMLAPVVTPQQYVAQVQDYMLAVLDGAVSETVWTRRGRVVRARSVIRLSGLPVVCSIWPGWAYYVGLLKKDMESREVEYRGLRP